MKRILYEEEIWAPKYKELHPNLLAHLTSKDCLIVIPRGEPPYKAILGVPHQAAIGEKHICESGNQRDSDENAASYALVNFDMFKEHDIPCKLVIIAHSTTADPNKDLDSPYCQEIFQDSAEHFIEYHGAGQFRKFDLELSAGKNKLADSLGFGEFLASALRRHYTLGIQKCCGSKEAIVFQKDGTKSNGQLKNPANETNSLIKAGEKGIPALHLEAKPQFRIPKDRTNTVTDDGFALGRALAETIIKCWIEGDRTCQSRRTPQN